MTVPVGLATYVFLPDTPYTTRALFLTQEEKDIAAARVLKAGKAAPEKVTVATFKRILRSWKWYAFVVGYVVSSSPSDKLHSILRNDLAIWLLMRRQRLLRHLAQVRRILGRRSKHHAHRHLAHLGDLCCTLGFPVGLYGQPIRLAVDTNGKNGNAGDTLSWLTWYSAGP